MIAFLATDMNWILELRNPIFTSFFKIFLFFASDLFYLSFVSVGYWGWNRSLFKELGVLVCVCTLLNVALKQVFDLPRPTIEHLVETLGTGGFPSGDVQVAVAFWMFLIFSLKQKSLWYIATPLIICMGLSRLYLGVHSPLDVLGGLMIGIFYAKAHVLVARSSFWKKLPEHTILYVWGILLTYGTYVYIVPLQKYAVSLSAGGCLLGIIIVTWLAKRSPLLSFSITRQEKLITVIGGVISTLALYHFIKWIPAHSLLPYTKFFAFAFLAIHIFYIWPKVAELINQKIVSS